MSNRLALIGIAAFLLLSFPVAALAQTCSGAEQVAMNTCVGDGVDACSGVYIYCKRQLQEVDDFRGLALEDCCCTAGEPESPLSFRSCRLRKVNQLTNARSLFSASFYSAARRSLRNMTFANCNFGCDF